MFNSTIGGFQNNDNGAAMITVQTPGAVFDSCTFVSTTMFEGAVIVLLSSPGRPALFHSCVFIGNFGTASRLARKTLTFMSFMQLRMVLSVAR